MADLQATAPLKLLYSVPSLGLDDSKGPPTFVFVTHEIPLPEFPYTFPEDAGFFITNGWLGEASSHQQQIELRDPQGHLVAETGNRELSIPDERPYTAITYFMGLSFPQPGRYELRISLDQTEVLTYPLFITESATDDEL